MTKYHGQHSESDVFLWREIHHIHISKGRGLPFSIKCGRLSLESRIFEEKCVFWETTKLTSGNDWSQMRKFDFLCLDIQNISGAFPEFGKRVGSGCHSHTDVVMRPPDDSSTERNQNMERKLVFVLDFFFLCSTTQFCSQHSRQFGWW